MPAGFPFLRVWAMPSADTFDCPPIRGFVQKYLIKSKTSIDPFSRNKRWATFTNDINPETAAESHLDARTFLEDLENRGIRADLIIFDPPYSPRQIREQYDSAGLKTNGKDTQNAVLYSDCRKHFEKLIVPGGIVLSFGWNSVGMGKTWEFIEGLLVCHGGAHNDTICLSEKKPCLNKSLL